MGETPSPLRQQQQQQPPAQYKHQPALPFLPFLLLYTFSLQYLCCYNNVYYKRYFISPARQSYLADHLYAESIWAASPSTTRGQPTQLSSDSKGERLAYAVWIIKLAETIISKKMAADGKALSSRINLSSSVRSITPPAPDSTPSTRLRRPSLAFLRQGFTSPVVMPVAMLGFGTVSVMESPRANTALSTAKSMTWLGTAILSALLPWVMVNNAMGTASPGTVETPLVRSSDTGSRSTLSRSDSRGLFEQRLAVTTWG